MRSWMKTELRVADRLGRAPTGLGVPPVIRETGRRRVPRMLGWHPFLLPWAAAKREAPNIMRPLNT